MTPWRKNMDAEQQRLLDAALDLGRQHAEYMDKESPDGLVTHSRHILLIWALEETINQHYDALPLNPEIKARAKELAGDCWANICSPGLPPQYHEVPLAHSPWSQQVAVPRILYGTGFPLWVHWYNYLERRP